jgi:hypothetical protein
MAMESGFRQRFVVLLIVLASTVSMLACESPSTAPPVSAETSTAVPAIDSTTASTSGLTDVVSTPIHISQPVILTNDKVRMTVLEINDLGDTVGSLDSVLPGVPGGVIAIKDEFKGTHYLLELKLRIENLTNDNLDFGTDAPCLAIEQEDGNRLELAGGGTYYNVGSDWSSGFETKVFTDRPAAVSFVFAAPNELAEITIYLLEVGLWLGP